jgi:ribosome biogenesis GTPase / thiamine phosphate phosphatase
LGKFKIDTEITSTNPLAVGDAITMQVQDEAQDIATIIGIDKRKNYIVRTSPHNRNQQHIIASNIDQAVLITSLINPRTSLGFVDRFLITSEIYNVPAIIIVNKIDLHTPEHEAILEEWQAIYESLGYTIIATSIEKNVNLEIVKELLSNKTTLFSGHSGVGKSTLINYLLPDLHLRTNIISEHSGKGMHTTTFSEMRDVYDANKKLNGKIIDTPGIKELGLVNVQRAELSGYFREMQHFAKDCKYNNCMHINEPQCAVLNAIEAEQISADRYQNYLNMLDSLPLNNYS